jgi:hypothetical protein
MFTAYFDGSGSSDTATIAVAGFVAPVEQWTEFERNWKDCLTAFGVSALHMKHYAHSRGEFAPWKGDKRKRQDFLERLISIIKTRVWHSFACAVMMEDYRPVDSEYCLHEFSNPYGLAAMTCIRKTLPWKEQYARHSELLHVFEAGDEGQGELIKLAKKYLDVTPVPLPKGRSVAFQAADLLAYEHLKVNVERRKNPDGKLFEDEVRRSLMALAAIPGGAHEGDWGIREADNLKDFCINCEIPLRNV